MLPQSEHRQNIQQQPPQPSLFSNSLLQLSLLQLSLSSQTNCTCRHLPYYPHYLMHKIQHVPSDSDTTSSSTQLEQATSALQQLQSTIQSANSTKTSLITQLHTLRQSLQSSFDSLTADQLTQTNAIQRASRALAVRAMELDNRALQLDHRESTLHTARTEFDLLHTKRKRALDDESRRLTQRETALLAREASLKYSAVEQMRLHAWSRELEKREARLGEAEDAEKERIATKVAAVARRELLVAEKETRLEHVIKQRESDVLRREKAVDAVAHSLERQRSEALLQIEAERSQFWAHQQKLSAVVAAETENLLTEQANLRKHFEEEALHAKLALKQMMKQVADMRNVVQGAAAVHANPVRPNGHSDDAFDVDPEGEDSPLVTKLAILHVEHDETEPHQSAAESVQ